MIEIQDLRDLNIEDIINLILDEKTQPFEIYVPKSTQRYFSDSRAIWLDYVYLAYSGQLLNDICDEFSYDEVSPEEHTSVRFSIRTANIKKLAETLLYISYGYVNDSEDEEFSCTEHADDYIACVENGEITPACPYFIEICNETKMEEMRDEDEE